MKFQLDVSRWETTIDAAEHRDEICFGIHLNPDLSCVPRTTYYFKKLNFQSIFLPKHFSVRKIIMIIFRLLAFIVFLSWKFMRSTVSIFISEHLRPDLFLPNCTSASCNILMKLFLFVATRLIAWNGVWTRKAIFKKIYLKNALNM